MNWQAVYAIYHQEMRRFFKTIGQSIASPVLSTSLYFVVFGAAIGSRIESVQNIPYGLFIVPGMLMLSLLTQSINNASFGIFFQKFTGTIYEIMSAPISSFEILLGFVGAAASKSIIVGLVILSTASFFVDLHIEYPLLMTLFFILTCISFSLFGFIIGLWANNFERLQIIPLLIITPLVFLGGSFYSVDMLPKFWQTITFFNPVLYIISGFRWSFFGSGDVSILTSLVVIFSFLAICCTVVWWIFKTGYNIKS